MGYTPSRLPPAAEAALLAGLGRPAREVARHVPLDLIDADPALSHRAEPHPDEAVADLAAAIDAGADPGPAVVYEQPAGRCLLADGFLRYAAYRLAGRGSMPCLVRPGDRKAAALASAAADKVPGVARRTNADKRRAVLMVVRECPEWTARRAADHVGVSHTFAARVLSDVATVATSPTRVDTLGRRQPATKPAPQPPPKAHVAADAAGAPAAAVPAPPPAPPPDPAVAFLRRLEDLCRRLDSARADAVALAADPHAGAARLADAAAQLALARAAAWAGRPGDPPAAVRVGSVSRRPLPDGRPYPETLAAHQLNLKHLALLEERFERLFEAPTFLLRGAPLTEGEWYDLGEFVKRTVLPEVYDPSYAG